jgi:hypothetical protein
MHLAQNWWSGDTSADSLGVLQTVSTPVQDLRQGSQRALRTWVGSAAW